jgi:hypothetical protein
MKSAKKKYLKILETSENDTQLISKTKQQCRLHARLSLPSGRSETPFLAISEKFRFTVGL